MATRLSVSKLHELLDYCYPRAPERERVLPASKGASTRVNVGVLLGQHPTDNACEVWLELSYDWADIPYEVRRARVNEFYDRLEAISAAASEPIW